MYIIGEDETPTVKVAPKLKGKPAAKPAAKKAESSSEDSSDEDEAPKKVVPAKKPAPAKGTLLIFVTYSNCNYIKFCRNIRPYVNISYVFILFVIIVNLIIFHFHLKLLHLLFG